MLHRIVGWIDFALFVALVALSLWVMVCRPWGLDPAATASLAGALFGSGAVLLANWINRANEQRKTADELEHKRTKLKAIITAELVNVTAGLLPPAIRWMPCTD